MKHIRAFSLLELLICLAIIMIIAGISYGAYESHLVSVRRADGQLALLKLSGALENYYLQRNTYKGATFNNIGSSEQSPQGFYQMAIVLQRDDQSYLIKAIPIGAQAKQDQACGTLTLTTDGRRSYEGRDPKASCW